MSCGDCLGAGYAKYRRPRPLLSLYASTDIIGEAMKIDIEWRPCERCDKGRHIAEILELDKRMQERNRLGDGI